MTYPSPEEFLPLAWFPWESRPKSCPLEVEEAATALFLRRGDISAAAERLKVTPAQLQRLIRRSPRLTRLLVRLSDGPSSDGESRPATGSQSPQEPTDAEQP